MSILKYLIICILTCSYGYAQTADEFILQYNRHIDPYNRLDSVIKTEFQMSNNIDFKSEFGSVNKNVKSLRNCNYYSNGKWVCDYNNNLGQNISESLSIPEEDGGNAVKIHLNVISTHKKRNFEFITQSDSIVVIEMTNSSAARHHYTFNKRTKDLLQIKRINRVDGKEYEAITTFISFVTIDDIIVPQRAKYQNNICTAEIEYSNQKFQYENYRNNEN
jgi:hypothetical protein